MCGRVRYADRAVQHLSCVPSATTKDEYVAKAIQRTIENAAPGMKLPVLVAGNQGGFAVEVMTWGLAPRYSTIQPKKDYKLFNKRIESFENPYFSTLLRQRRCVCIVDGFYEWKGEPLRKQPFYVHLHDQPIFLAGIYEDRCLDTDSENDGECGTKSFAILTGDPCDGFKDIHSRQPVVMSAAQSHQWLDLHSHVDALLKSLRGNSKDDTFQSTHQLHYHAVTKQISSPEHQGPDCSAPVELPIEDAIVLFGLQQVCTADVESLVGTKRKRNSN